MSRTAAERLIDETFWVSAVQAVLVLGMGGPCAWCKGALRPWNLLSFLFYLPHFVMPHAPTLLGITFVLQLSWVCDFHSSSPQDRIVSRRS